MRKIAILIVALLLVASLPVIPHCELENKEQSATGTRLPAYWVNADNKLGPWDGTSAHPFKNLTWAVSNATQGGYIYVYGGTYNEQVSVNKKLYIIGNSSGTTIIDGGNSKTTLNITASSCRIFGLTIRGGGSISNNKDSGLKILASYTKVENCSISYNLYNGLYASSSNVYIYNTSFKSNNRGINLQNPNYVYINNCKFELNTNYGIYTSVTRNTYISNCSFNNTKTAIRFFDGDWTNVTSSSFSNNTLGIYLSWTDHTTLKNNTFLLEDNDISTEYSIDNKISNNRFFHCKYNCIQTQLASSKNRIHNNTLHAGSIGMMLSMDSYSFVNDNTFDSGWGAMIYLDGAKYMNVSRNRGDTGFNGLYIYSSNTNRITDNEFSNTKWPIEIEANPNTVDSFLNQISRNKVIGADMGIWIKGSEKDRVENNTLISCDKGILFNSTNRTTVCDNTFIDTGSKCVELQNSKCVGNYFYHNNMLGCGPSKDLKQARDNGTNSIWNASSEGNFWYDWQSPDADCNGIVDLPCAVSGTAGAKDNFPLTRPFGGPRITTMDVNTTLTDVLYSNHYSAIDSNTSQAALAWGLRTNAGWLGLNGTWLNGTPLETDIGSYWVNVSVSDGYYGDFTNFTLEVRPMIVSPIINASGLPLVWTEDIPQWHAFGIVNPKPSDTFAWSVSSNAKFLSISAIGNLSGMPLNTDVGSYWVNVTVSDPVRGNGSRNSTLTVLNANDPPVISSAAMPSAIEGVAYWHLFTANDPDPTNDTLTWAMKSDAVFLSMNSGNISGLPGNADVGSHWVNVSVNDGNGGNDWLNLTLIVENVNDAPYAIENVKEISIYEDSTDVSIFIPSLFSDIDGDQLIYGVSTKVNLTATLLANKTLELVPAPDWNGHETLFVSANDSHSSASVQLNVTVLPRNDAPTDAAITFLETAYVEGGTQRVQGVAYDADLPYGDTLTYTWYSNRTGKIGEGPSRNLSLKAGYHTITLNVTDSKNAWILVSKPLVVLPKSTGNVTDDDVVPDDDVDDDIIPDDDVDDDTQNGTDDDTNSTGGLDLSTMVVVLGMIAVLFVIMIIAAFVYMRGKKAGKREEEEEIEDEVVEEKELIPEPKRVAAASTRAKEAPAEVFAPRKKRTTHVATPAPAPKKTVSRPIVPVEEAVPAPYALAPLLESAPEGLGAETATEVKPEDVPDESGPGIKAEEPPKDPKVEEKKELDDIFGDL